MTRTKELLNVTALVVALLLLACPAPGQLAPRLEPGAPLVVTVTDTAGTPLDIVHVGLVPADDEVLALQLPDLGDTGLWYAVHTRVIPADDTTAGVGTLGCFWFGGKAPIAATGAAYLIPKARGGVAVLVEPDRRVRGLEGEAAGNPYGEGPPDVTGCPWGGCHPGVVPTLGTAPDGVLTLGPNAVRRDLHGRAVADGLDPAPAEDQGCFWFGGKAPNAAAGAVLDGDPADAVVLVDLGRRVRGLDGEVDGNAYGQGDTPGDVIVCPWGGWHPDVLPTLGTAVDGVLTLGPGADGYGLDARLDDRRMNPPTPPMTCELAPHLARPVTIVPLAGPHTADAPELGAAQVTMVVADTGLGLVVN